MAVFFMWYLQLWFTSILP